MRSVEYQRWDPIESPLCVEFPRELLLELGWSESSGVLYGSRHGREVRVAALNVPQDEEQEKVGVFASRIRGEVFLTESDLTFMNQEHADLALVVAGQRAGFFVHEANGSIQTVRSHEEFSTAAPLEPQVSLPTPAMPGSRLPSTWIRWRERIPSGAVAMAAVPLVAWGALAVLPQRPAQTPRSIQVREIEHQLRISWEPGRNGVLTIEDGSMRVSIPVTKDQSTVTYAMQGPQVEVSLLSMDDNNRVRKVTTSFRNPR